MKNPSDPRHKKRIVLLKKLFSWSFQKQTVKNQSIQKIIKKLPQIDKIIAESAPQFPIEQINKIDLAVLRLAIWELLFFKKTPYKVVIDEAVELAKQYGGERSSQFINGVLGSIVKKYVSSIRKKTKN